MAIEGGLGIVSSACLDRLVSRRIGRKVNTYEAVKEEITRSKIKDGFVGINIMAALGRDFTDSVKGAIDAGSDAIISGAGLPLNLPAIQPPKDTALIPIVSSARALDIICKKWEKLGYRPDAVVLEGPLAGGHLGFRIDQIDLESNKLENLLPQLKTWQEKYGDFPVIVAGGIYTHDDILNFIDKGQTASRWVRVSSPQKKAALLQSTRTQSFGHVKKISLLRIVQVLPVACHSE